MECAPSKLGSSSSGLIRPCRGWIAMKAAAFDHTQPGQRPTPDSGQDVGDTRQQSLGAVSPSSKLASSLQLPAEAEDWRIRNLTKSRSTQKRYRDRQKASDAVQVSVVACNSQLVEQRQDSLSQGSVVHIFFDNSHSDCPDVLSWLLHMTAADGSSVSRRAAPSSEHSRARASIPMLVICLHVMLCSRPKV